MQRTTALCSGSGSGSGAAARHTLAALQRPSASRPSCSSSRGVALPAIRGRHHQLEQQQQQQQFRCRSADAAAAPTTAAAAAAVGAPPDDLTPEQQQQWSACVARLVGLGFAEADADRTVSRAFGWGTQAYWRREKVREPPEAARLEAVVALLLDLGLTDAEVPRVIKVGGGRRVGPAVSNALPVLCGKQRSRSRRAPAAAPQTPRNQPPPTIHPLPSPLVKLKRPSPRCSASPWTR